VVHLQVGPTVLVATGTVALDVPHIVAIDAAIRLRGGTVESLGLGPIHVAGWPATSRWSIGVRRLLLAVRIAGWHLNGRPEVAGTSGRGSGVIVSVGGFLRRLQGVGWCAVGLGAAMGEAGRAIGVIWRGVTVARIRLLVQVLLHGSGLGIGANAQRVMRFRPTRIVIAHIPVLLLLLRLRMLIMGVVVMVVLLLGPRLNHPIRLHAVLLVILVVVAMWPVLFLDDGVGVDLLLGWRRWWLLGVGLRQMVGQLLGVVQK